MTCPHECVHVLRVQLLRLGGRADDVDKQHGNLLALALYRTAVIENFLGQVLGGVTARSARIRYRPGDGHRLAASHAEFRARGDLAAAL